MSRPSISKVSLQLCLFIPLRYTTREIKQSLALVDFSSEVKTVKGKKNGEDMHNMIVKTHFDLMRDAKNPNFLFQVCYETIYTAKDKADFDVIKEHVAIAHVIPYVRELASSLTARANFKPLIIPPLNTLYLYNQYLEKKSEKDGKDEPGQKK